jgi:aromatic ring-cleaving dioxygenase
MIFLIVGFFALVVSHPDRWLANMRVINQQHCSPDSVFFYSFHLHVLFEHLVPTRVTAAARMMAEFEAAFGGTHGIAQCNDTQVSNTTYPVVDICFLEWDVPPVRPFPVAEWAYFIPPREYSRVAMWAMKHRGDLDVLLHSNSGCEVSDHRDWPLWGGHAWPLDLTALHYDCPACTMDSCLKKTAVVLAEPNVTTLCGLDAAFVPRREAAFCSPACQVWAQSLLRMAQDCPHFCDSYANTTEFASCSKLFGALPTIAIDVPRCQPL